MDPILELRSLSKQYPGHLALDRVSLQVPRGAFYSLLGPSGCGKTTTLRIIGGFEQPTAGEVLLGGICVNQRPPYERNVSTVFQSYALFPHLTVRQNVEFGLRRKRAQDIASRVETILEIVQLREKKSRYPAQLSGGERQRVALARSLVIEPDVLLLDEPLAALDPTLRRQMRLELKSMQRQLGVTFLFVTHDQEEAMSMSDCIAVMSSGRIEQIGAPEEVYLRPRTRFVAGFLGSVNWIDGIGLRPEATKISPGTGTACGRLATVVRSVFLGDCVQVVARPASGPEVVAQVGRQEANYRPGDSVQISWDPAEEMKFE